MTLKIILNCLAFCWLTASSAQTLRAGLWEPFDQNNLDSRLIFDNSNEIIDGLDNDKNGYIDDIHGIAFGLKNELIYIPFLATKENKDYYFHGTAVAYLLTNDLKKTQIVGIGFIPLTQRLERRGLLNLTPELRVKQLKTELSELEFFVRKSIDYFKKMNVKVVNISWGKGLEALLERNTNLGKTKEEKRKNGIIWLRAFKNYLQKGMQNAPEILFVAAAGNDGLDAEIDLDTPGSLSLPNLVVVGSKNSKNAISDFSNYGKSVLVYASGENVSFLVDGKTYFDDGTSLSTPQVANFALHLLEKDASLSVLQLKRKILDHFKNN